MTLLSISSKDRNQALSNSSSDFTIIFPTIIPAIASVELISVSLPNTIYKIQDYNNLFTWSHDSNNYSITIPNGAYSIYSLLTYLQTQMNNTADANSYVLTYNPTTFTMNITGTTAFILTFSNNNTCYKELGFSNADTSLSSNITGPYSIQLYNPLSIYILINEFGVNNLTSSNIQFTFKIPILVNSNTIVEFDTNSFYCQKINYNGKISFNQLTIQLIDSNGRSVNLNNADWEMLIKLNE